MRCKRIAVSPGRIFWEWMVGKEKVKGQVLQLLRLHGRKPWEGEKEEGEVGGGQWTRKEAREIWRQCSLWNPDGGGGRCIRRWNLIEGSRNYERRSVECKVRWDERWSVFISDFEHLQFLAF